MPQTTPTPSASFEVPPERIWKDLTVCFPTSHRPDMAILGLSSILGQSILPGRIVVYDNGPMYRLSSHAMFTNMAELATLRGIKFEYHLGHRRGIVRARIEVERIAMLENPKFLWMADDDLLYTSTFVSLCKSKIEDGFDVAGGVIYSAESTVPGDSFLPADVWPADVIVGGTIVYSSVFSGLYSKILEYTEGVFDDRFWQLFAQEKGATLTFLSKDGFDVAQAHLSKWMPQKYPKIPLEMLKELTGQHTPVIANKVE